MFRVPLSPHTHIRTREFGCVGAKVIHDSCGRLSESNACWGRSASAAGRANESSSARAVPVGNPKQEEAIN